MNTDAVMCMAFTKQSPSWTPLLRTRFSTVCVMFTKPRRFGTSNQSCSVRLFTGHLCHGRSAVSNPENAKRFTPQPDQRLPRHQQLFRLDPFCIALAPPEVLPHSACDRGFNDA